MLIETVIPRLGVLPLAASQAWLVVTAAHGHLSTLLTAHPALWDATLALGVLLRQFLAHLLQVLAVIQEPGVLPQDA